jgi:hypothetical protein
MSEQSLFCVGVSSDRAAARGLGARPGLLPAVGPGGTGDRHHGEAGGAGTRTHLCFNACATATHAPPRKEVVSDGK